MLRMFKGGRSAKEIEFLKDWVKASGNDQGGSRRVGLIHAVEVSWQGRSLIGNFYCFTWEHEAAGCLREAIATGLPGCQETWITGVSMQKKLGGSIVVGSTQVGLTCADGVSTSYAVLSNLLHAPCRSGPLSMPTLKISLCDTCLIVNALPNVCPLVDRVANGPQKFKREGLVPQNKFHENPSL